MQRRYQIARPLPARSMGRIILDKPGYGEPLAESASAAASRFSRGSVEAPPTPPWVLPASPAEPEPALFEPPWLGARRPASPRTTKMQRSSMQIELPMQSESRTHVAVQPVESASSMSAHTIFTSEP
jgi:hypothetical protein